MDVGDLLRSVFPGDEIADHLHRPRPVQGVHRHKVRNRRGFELPEPVGHPGTLELEHGNGVPARKELECLRVVLGDAVKVDRLPAGFLDHAQAVLENGERPEAEEVHLEKAGCFQVLHVVLGHDLGLGSPVQRDEVADVPRRDHDPGGVHARVPVHPLEDERSVDERAHPRIRALRDPFKIGHGLKRLRERPDLPLLHGDLLRDGFERAQRDPENPPDVLDHGA